MPNHEEIDPMLTTSEVARLLNVHINTVRRWSNQGVLKTYRIGARGDRRFHREDIISFLSQKSKMASLGPEVEIPSLVELDQSSESGEKLSASVTYRSK
jgi:excisionase family DNA binding protein